jgi:uncharacterized protein (TIGR00251 family)
VNGRTGVPARYAILETARGTMGNWYEIRGQDCLLHVRVQPRSSREGIDGVRDGRLRVRVSPPAVGGAANERLIRLLAHALGVPKTHISLLRGAKIRDKDLLARGAGAFGSDIDALLAPGN